MRLEGVIVMSGYAKPAVFLFIIVIAAGICGGFMAADKGRRVAGWCLLSALLPPVLIFLYFARPIREVEGRFRKCLNCGELIKWNVPVCEYCKSKQQDRNSFSSGIS